MMQGENIMQKFIISAVAAAMLASSLTACTEAGGIDGATVGPLVGAVAGGFLGSQFGEGSGKTAMAIAGTLAGAWAGSKVAAGLSAQDRGYYDAAATRAAAAPVGQQITWTNPTSGVQGTITPTRDGRAADGAACREYQQTVSIGGKTERAYGTACKQPDGSWKIIN
jgi:surface antigen